MPWERRGGHRGQGGGKGGGGGERKRKSFRAVGFYRYTRLNGLATSGRQPEPRVQIPAHKQAREYGVRTTCIQDGSCYRA